MRRAVTEASGSGFHPFGRPMICHGAFARRLLRGTLLNDNRTRNHPMLTLGGRSYRLVRAQSGFHVTLGDRQDLAVGDQWWRFEAHYVPADDDRGPGPVDTWEYWRLMISPMLFQTNDWRLLTEYAISEPADFPFPAGSAENLLGGGGSRADALMLRPGELRVLRRDGFLFTCEFEGEIDLPAGHEGGEEPVEFRLLDEIPFAGVSVHVPVNSADPVKAARALAAREIGLGETARFHVALYDPERRRVPRMSGPGKHSVTLETGWFGTGGEADV